MKPLEEYEKAAREGRPFSNGTEWEIWQWNVCGGRDNEERRCVHDDTAESDGGCPLILLALNDKTPAEWTGPHGRYRCTEKTTAAEARAAANRAQRAEERAALEAAHYPMFELPAGGEGQ